MHDSQNISNSRAMNTQGMKSAIIRLDSPNSLSENRAKITAIFPPQRQRASSLQG